MLTVEQIRNSVWKNQEYTLIECEVKFAEYNDFLPFGASINGDQYAHTKEVFDRASSGEFGDVSPYVPETVPPEQQPSTTGSQDL
jgi:hypothetical protein